MITIKRKVGDYEVTATGKNSEETISQILEAENILINKLEKINDFSLTTTDTAPNERGMSLSEFINQRKPRTHVEIILSMAYYMFKVRKKEYFTRADIDTCYSEARLPKPSNINDLINTNVRKGHIMYKGELSGVKSWTITQTGEQIIENPRNE